jgi:hypothetical protein
MKFFKRLLNTIKNIFIKNYPTKKNNLEKLPNEQQVNVDYKELYAQIEIGDIIWAKRYKNETQMESISLGHREGPFIVINKLDEVLICAQGTSVPPHKQYYDNYFYLNNQGYNLTKETYFKLHRMDFINDYSLIRIVDKLKEKDKNSLFRQIKSLHKIYYTENSQMIRLNLPIQIGDIVSYTNNNFIVLDINDNNVICGPLKNNIDYKKKLNINSNNFKDIDYSKTICFELDSIKYINTVSSNYIKNILNKWQEYINYRKNIDITQRGTIILKDSKLYYIYGEEGQEWLVFEISNKFIENSERLEIGNSEYYTKYEESKINKKDLFDNIFLCLDKDKDRIKHLRKSYKETKKSQSLYGSSEFVYFKVGDIIENINYKNKRYIVINIHKKTYECLNINDIKNAIYNPILIKKIDAKRSNNNSIQGIKWLEKNENIDLSELKNKDILNEIFKMQNEYIKNKQINGKLYNVSQLFDTKQSSDYIKINAIIKKDEFTDETFIVKDVIGDMLVCISNTESGRANPRKYYFNKNNVIFVENKQKRK